VREREKGEEEDTFMPYEKRRPILMQALDAYDSWTS
jgi:hypothetical protein